jgi:hypothetical protein
VFAQLDPNTRRLLTAAGATVELLDSTAILGGWTAGQVRTYSGALQERIDRLQDDTISGVHEPTANLDRLAISSVLRSRQQMAATQLQSALVDQLIAVAKSRREAEAEALNGQLRALKDGGETSRSSLEGTAGILSNWGRE